MIGLSPKPETRVESYSEYLVRTEMVDKHIIAVAPTTLTFGSYDKSRNVEWTPYEYDRQMREWAFMAHGIRLESKMLLPRPTKMNINNFIPGIYIQSNDQHLPSIFV